MTGKSSTRGLQLLLQNVDGAALRVRVKRVARCAHHELTLVGLADVHVHPAGDHDAVEHRLDDVGDESLKRITLEWGRRMPAMAASSGVRPAPTSPTFPAAM